MITLAIASFIAGLGFFFVGLNSLTSNLKALSGKKLRDFLSKFTRNIFMGVLWGGVITMLTQSLSALVFTLVGMIKAKVMNVRQALPLIMGGNMLGGLILYIIAIDIKVGILLLIGLTGILLTTSKFKEYRKLLGVLFGLALIFYGLYIMQTGVAPLTELPWFKQSLANTQGLYLVIFLMSVLITIIVQSSLATIVIGLALLNGGLISFIDAIMVVYGGNVGSSVLTYLLSSKIKGQSRQIAMFQAFYNIFGALILLPLFYIEILGGIPLVKELAVRLVENQTTQIAIVNTVFNFIPGFILIIFTNPIANLLGRLWPESLEEKISAPKYLFEKATEDPENAIELIRLEQGRLIEFYTLILDKLRGKNAELELEALEEAFETLSRSIFETIVELSDNRFSNNDLTEILNHLLNLHRTIETTFIEFTEFNNELASLRENEMSAKFADSLIEGLDAIQLTLLSVMETREMDEYNLFRKLTSFNGNGISNIRKMYLNQHTGLDHDQRLYLLSASNHSERIILALGSIGRSFYKSGVNMI